MTAFKKINKAILSNDIFTKILSILIFLYLCLVYVTSKKTIIYSSKFNQDLYHKKNAICVCWHNRIALIPFLKPKNVISNAVSSTSRDAKIAAGVLRLLKYKLIFGSAKKNAYQAAKGVEEKLQQGESIFMAPDGPKGPVYNINGNIVRFAGKHSVYIIAVAYSSTKFKRLKTWDQFIVPLPFGKIYFVWGNPIKVPSNINEEEVAQFNLILKRELDRITSIADRMIE